MLCDAVQGLRTAVDPRRTGPGRGVGAQDSRAEGHRSFVDAERCRAGATDSRRRAGAGHPVRHACRRLCASASARRRSSLSERREADHAHVETLWNAALGQLSPGWTVNGSADHRYHGNLNIRRDGLDAARLISDLRDIAFSLGSACASGSGRPSHVLRAVGLSDREARSSIRLGFGRYTSKDELIDAVRRIDTAARGQQGLAA